MKTMLPALLAALMGLASCSKKDEAPQVAKSAGLEGRWQMVSDDRIDYTPTGTVASTTSSLIPGANFSAEITATLFTPYAGNMMGTPQPYTRNGMVVHLGSGTSPATYKTITELTDHRLVWNSPVDGAFPSAYPSVYTTVYTR